MEGKQYIGVLFVAALIGAGLGGAAIGIAPLVTTGTPTQVPLTSTAGVTSTIKSSVTAVQPAAATTATSQPPVSTGQTGGTTQGSPVLPPATGVIVPVGNSVTGIVQSIKDNLVIIKTDTGSLVSVTLNTMATIQYTAPASLTDVKAGSTITVTGNQDSSSIKASSIIIGSASGLNPVPTMTGALPTGFPGVTSTNFPNMTGNRPTNQPGTQTRPPQTNAIPPTGLAQPPTGLGTSGTVQAIEGNTITIARNGATTKIEVDGSTTYQKTSAATVANIKAGSSVTAAGATQNDGTFQAMSMTINTTEVP